MKALVIALALIVGGIKLGCVAFDSTVETAQQSNTAQMIKARHTL